MADARGAEAPKAGVVGGAAPAEAHWSRQKEEVSSNRPIKFLVWLVSWLPAPVMTVIVFGVAFFYFVFSKRARTDARRYQERLLAWLDSRGIPRSERQIGRVSVYWQIFSFSLCVVEKIAGWSGKTKLSHVEFHDDGVVALKQQLAEGKGAYLIGSHLGNVELFRSLASYGQTGVPRQVPVTAIVDMDVTAEFNRTLTDLNPAVSLNLVNASDIGVDTMEQLADTVAAGGLVVIAADRTSANAPERNVVEPFLGVDAEFPYGAFLLADLLGAPVYYMFALRKKTVMWRPRYHMFVQRSTVDLAAGGRRGRSERIRALCHEYVGLLETYSARYPFQWYNFFDFWRRTEGEAT